MLPKKREDRKGFLDKKVSKFVSRKFMVWITATVALFYGTLVSSDWVIVAVTYIGTEGVASIAGMMKFGKTFGPVLNEGEQAPQQTTPDFLDDMEEVDDADHPERIDNCL